MQKMNFLMQVPLLFLVVLSGFRSLATEPEDLEAAEDRSFKVEISQNKSNTGYEFNYAVSDTIDSGGHAHHESSVDGTTKGEYSVSLPDGRVQVVNYIADDKGYRANITYVDLANHRVEHVVYAPVSPGNDGQNENGLEGTGLRIKEQNRKRQPKQKIYQGGSQYHEDTRHSVDYPGYTEDQHYYANERQPSGRPIHQESRDNDRYRSKVEQESSHSTYPEVDYEVVRLKPSHPYHKPQPRPLLQIDYPSVSVDRPLNHNTDALTTSGSIPENVDPEIYTINRPQSHPEREKFRQQDIDALLSELLSQAESDDRDLRKQSINSFNSVNHVIDLSNTPFDREYERSSKVVQATEEHHSNGLQNDIRAPKMISPQPLYDNDVGGRVSPTNKNVAVKEHIANDHSFKYSSGNHNSFSYTLFYPQGNEKELEQQPPPPRINLPASFKPNQPLNQFKGYGNHPLSFQSLKEHPYSSQDDARQSKQEQAQQVLQSSQLNNLSPKTEAQDFGGFVAQHQGQYRSHSFEGQTSTRAGNGKETPSLNIKPSLLLSSHSKLHTEAPLNFKHDPKQSTADEVIVQHPSLPIKPSLLLSEKPGRPDSVQVQFSFLQEVDQEFDHQRYLGLPHQPPPSLLPDGPHKTPFKPNSQAQFNLFPREPAETGPSIYKSTEPPIVPEATSQGLSQPHERGKYNIQDTYRHLYPENQPNQAEKSQVAQQYSLPSQLAVESSGQRLPYSPHYLDQGDSRLYPSAGVKVEQNSPYNPFFKSSESNAGSGAGLVQLSAGGVGVEQKSPYNPFFKSSEINTLNEAGPVQSDSKVYPSAGVNVDQNSPYNPFFKPSDIDTGTGANYNNHVTQYALKPQAFENYSQQDVYIASLMKPQYSAGSTHDKQYQLQSEPLSGPELLTQYNYEGKRRDPQGSPYNRHFQQLDHEEANNQFHADSNSHSPSFDYTKAIVQQNRTPYESQSSQAAHDYQNQQSSGQAPKPSETAAPAQHQPYQTLNEPATYSFGAQLSPNSMPQESSAVPKNNPVSGSSPYNLPYGDVTVAQQPIRYSSGFLFSQTDATGFDYNANQGGPQTWAVPQGYQPTDGSNSAVPQALQKTDGKNVAVPQGHQPSGSSNLALLRGHQPTYESNSAGPRGYQPMDGWSSPHGSQSTGGSIGNELSTDTTQNGTQHSPYNPSYNGGQQVPYSLHPSNNHNPIQQTGKPTAGTPQRYAYHNQDQAQNNAQQSPYNPNYGGSQHVSPNFPPNSEPAYQQNKIQSNPQSQPATQTEPGYKEYGPQTQSIKTDASDQSSPYNPHYASGQALVNNQANSLSPKQPHQHNLSHGSSQSTVSQGSYSQTYSETPQTIQQLSHSPHTQNSLSRSQLSTSNSSATHGNAHKPVSEPYHHQPSIELFIAQNHGANPQSQGTLNPAELQQQFHHGQLNLVAEAPFYNPQHHGGSVQSTDANLPAENSANPYYSSPSSGIFPVEKIITPKPATWPSSEILVQSQGQAFSQGNAQGFLPSYQRRLQQDKAQLYIPLPRPTLSPSFYYSSEPLLPSRKPTTSPPVHSSPPYNPHFQKNHEVPHGRPGFQSHGLYDELSKSDSSRSNQEAEQQGKPNFHYSPEKYLPTFNATSPQPVHSSSPYNPHFEKNSEVPNDRSGLKGHGVQKELPQSERFGSNQLAEGQGKIVFYHSSGSSLPSYNLTTVVPVYLSSPYNHHFQKNPEVSHARPASEDQGLQKELSQKDNFKSNQQGEHRGKPQQPIHSYGEISSKPFPESLYYEDLSKSPYYQFPSTGENTGHSVPSYSPYASLKQQQTYSTALPYTHPEQSHEQDPHNFAVSTPAPEPGLSKTPAEPSTKPYHYNLAPSQSPQLVFNTTQSTVENFDSQRLSSIRPSRPSSPEKEEKARTVFIAHALEPRPVVISHGYRDSTSSPHSSTTTPTTPFLRQKSVEPSLQLYQFSGSPSGPFPVGGKAETDREILPIADNPIIYNGLPPPGSYPPVRTAHYPLIPPRERHSPYNPFYGNNGIPTSKDYIPKEVLLNDPVEYWKPEGADTSARYPQGHRFDESPEDEPEPKYPIVDLRDGLNEVKLLPPVVTFNYINVTLPTVQAVTEQKVVRISRPKEQKNIVQSTTSSPVLAKATPGLRHYYSPPKFNGRYVPTNATLFSTTTRPSTAYFPVIVSPEPSFNSKSQETTENAVRSRRPTRRRRIKGSGEPFVEFKVYGKKIPAAGTRAMPLNLEKQDFSDDQEKLQLHNYLESYRKSLSSRLELTTKPSSNEIRKRPVYRRNITRIFQVKNPGEDRSKRRPNLAPIEEEHATEAPDILPALKMGWSETAPKLEQTFEETYNEPADYDTGDENQTKATFSHNEESSYEDDDLEYRTDLSRVNPYLAHENMDTDEKGNQTQTSMLLLLIDKLKGMENKEILDQIQMKGMTADKETRQGTSANTAVPTSPKPMPLVVPRGQSGHNDASQQNRNDSEETSSKGLIPKQEDTYQQEVPFSSLPPPEKRVAVSYSTVSVTASPVVAVSRSSTVRPARDLDSFLSNLDAETRLYLKKRLLELKNKKQSVMNQVENETLEKTDMSKVMKSTKLTK